MGQVQPSSTLGGTASAPVLADENEQITHRNKRAESDSSNLNVDAEARKIEDATTLEVSDRTLNDHNNVISENVLNFFSELDPQSSKTIKNRRSFAKKVQRRSLLPWKKRKESKEFGTTGITVQLDDNHSMLLYRPTEQHLKGYLSLKNERKGRRNFYYGLDRPCQLTYFSDIKTKLVMKDAAEMKNIISMNIKGKRDSNIDISIVCGVQIFVTRYNDCGNFNREPSESAPQSRSIAATKGGFSSSRSLQGVKLLQPTYLKESKLQGLLSIGRDKLFSKEQRRADISPPGSSLHTKQPIQRDFFSRNHPNLSKVHSAIFSQGMGTEIFSQKRVENTSISPVEEMICIDEANEIYVCDIGITPEQCDFIVDTTERCSRGNYAAYTYAKQTLGCRDYDDLATLCEWPILRAYTSIMEHLEEKIASKTGRAKRNLVLDEREPHLVKYDTSKKERQKLDMHTDKSEWTIIIALSDGNGVDYFGGGTYIECINSTIHLEKGHALIFPGKRRHRGQKIMDGIRFLLVGFLVDKEDQASKKVSNSVVGKSDFDFSDPF
jgi:hypothetical protein